MSDYSYPTLDPQSVQAYESAKTRARQKRDQDLATNAYARFVSQQRYGRTRNDLSKAYTQERDTTPDSFAARGTLNSGLYQQALQDYASRRSQDFSRLGEDQAQQLGEFDRQATGISTGYEDALAEIEAQRQAQIAAIAAALSAARGR
jgi:hypothetical protein